ncbi:MAG: gfo/Idh/MocA family oxidoreductase, partial [Pseudoalteromonas distincta]
LVKQNILESPVNTHILASNVMSVLDEARKQLGVVYPND